jgi:predicted transposase YdaD
VETYLQLKGRDAEELDALLARSPDEEIQVMRARKMSWAEQIFTEGREEGEEIGVQKGVEQGFQQTLLLQLGLRFGPLSDEVKRRVEGIHSVDRLKEILEKILVARSLEEMGLQ